jgi:hypothetical protein
MALTKNLNSYVTVIEADSYFENRLDVAAWLSATETQKSQALVTATSVLDELDWIGFAISELQSLAFPRSGSYFDPKYGITIEFDSSVPNRVVVATYELAYHFLNNDGLLDDAGKVSDLKVANISLSKIRSPNRIPSTVRRQITPLLYNSGANSWWRAN